MNPSLIKKVVKKVVEKKKEVVAKIKENSQEGKGLLGLDKKDTSGPSMSSPALDPYPSFSAGRVGVDGSESKPTKPMDYRDAPYAPAYDAGYGSTSRREF